MAPLSDCLLSSDYDEHDPIRHPRLALDHAAPGSDRVPMVASQQLNAPIMALGAFSETEAARLP
jgi:hypothetical protein